MKIGLVMPVGWGELREYLSPEVQLPKPLEFPFGSNLAVQLRRLGHEVHIFTLCHDAKDEINTGKDGLYVHIAGYRYPFRMCYIDGFKVESARIKKMLLEWPCDIYNAHWQYEFARPVVEFGGPHVVTVRDNPWKVLWLFKPKSYRFMRLCLSYYVLSKAKFVSVTSPYMAEYVRRWHFYRDEIAIIPNAVFDCCKEHIAKREKCGIVFVEIANGFSPCKNVKTLLKAFKIVRDQLGELVRLRLYGTSYGSSEVAENWAIRKGVAAGVEFKGRTDRKQMLNELSTECDVFVHASKEESFGAVIVEAMSAGLPTIVGSSSGACPWVAGNGETGLLVDVTSSKALADAMIVLARNRELRRKFSIASRSRVMHQFSLEAIAKRYEMMYQRILLLNK